MGGPFYFETSMTASRQAPPFRADIIGSFIRPPELLAARRAHGGDLVTLRPAEPKSAHLIDLENRAIRVVAAMQEEAGLRVVTDGEFRRIYYYEGFLASVPGIEPRLVQDGAGVKFKSGFVAPRIAVAGKLRWPEGGVTVPDFRYLQSVTRATPKMTIPSPLHSMFYREGLVDRTAYPDMAELWADMADIYVKELAALAVAGCTYVQLDDTTLIRLCDPKFVAYLSDRGIDPARELEQWIDVLADVAVRKPDGMTLAIHTCRGNGPGGSFVSTGGYEPIADRLFNRVAADVYLLEYDTERAGDFAPLRLIPDGKAAVLGLVSTKLPALEDAADLRRRIEAAGKFIPLERLAISPQCGFASSVLDPPLTEADQRRKLDLLVRVATDVWGHA